MENFSRVWELLEKHNFEFDFESILNIKCVICNGLLNNAYEGPCGCSYCKRCLLKYLDNGGICCPSEECQVNYVVIKNEIVQSNSSNKKVSKLIVKCPFKLCYFRCELIRMSDHLRVCNQRSLCCLYSEIGCQNIEMSYDELSNHMVTDSQIHNKLLIDSILNLKNEISFLVNSRQTPIESELKNLIQSLESKVSKNSKEIDAMDELRAEIKELKNKVSELYKMTKEMKESFDQKIKDCVKNQKQLIQESVQDNLLKICSDFKNPKEQNTSKEKTELADNSQIIVNSSAKNDLIISAQFKWNISNISQLRKKSGTFTSEYFNSINKEYQMWLKLYPRGFGDGNHLSVEFRMKSGNINFKNQWPFKGIVSIIISDKVNPQLQSPISKRCHIEEKYQGSEFFHFSYSDLEKKDILLNNSIFIECTVSITD